MKRLTTAVVELKNDERGLSTLEYIVVVVLVGLVGIGAWRIFGTTLRAVIGG